MFRSWKLEGAGELGIARRRTRPADSIPVSVAAGRDLAAEHAIDEHEITGGDGHSQSPPDQADLERVLAGMGIMDGDVARGVGGGYQENGAEWTALRPGCRRSQDEKREKERRRAGRANIPVSGSLQSHGLRSARRMTRGYRNR